MRDGFNFELLPPDGNLVQANTDPDVFSSHLSAMWNWTKPDRARVWLTSNSLEKIVNREDGTKHAAFALMFGERFTFRISA